MKLRDSIHGWETKSVVPIICVQYYASYISVPFGTALKFRKQNVISIL